MKEISKIGRKGLILGPIDAVYCQGIRKLCLHPYFNHPNGCPNYGRRRDCPPRAIYFPKIFKDEVKIAAVIFNFEDYLKLKKIEHPDWTERALRNPRHWQGHLKSELKRLISENSLGEAKDSEIVFNPEAMGVNVTQTCLNAGLKLEWPPQKIVCRVALVCRRRDYFKVVTEDLKSVGLLGAVPIQYKIGEWVYPLETLSNHPRKGGGLWVVRKRSDAFRVKKYLLRTRGLKTRIFICRIGDIIFETSYRVKTSRVMLSEEILTIS